MFNVTPSLLRLQLLNMPPLFGSGLASSSPYERTGPPLYTGRRRVMRSRLRSSMRITSAPKSASSRVASAPTTIQQKSVTRTPANGPRRALGRREGSVGTSVMGTPNVDRAAQCGDSGGKPHGTHRPSMKSRDHHDDFGMLDLQCWIHHD